MEDNDIWIIIATHHQILKLKRQIQIKFLGMTQKLWKTVVSNQIM